MNEGEVRFHLREIHSHWTSPQLSTETIAELVRQELIERSEDRISIRLTKEGTRQKLAARQRNNHSGISLVRKPERQQRRPRAKRQPVTRARPLV